MYDGEEVWPSLSAENNDNLIKKAVDAVFQFIYKDD